MKVGVYGLGRFGFFDFVLPWSLTLAIVYGILTKTKFISEEYSVNGLIAITIAFFLINYMPVPYSLGEVFTNIFGIGIIVIIILLIVVLFLAMTGIEIGDLVKDNKIIAILLIATILIIIISIIGGSMISEINVDSPIVAILFAVIIFAMALSFLGKSGEN